MTYAEVHIWGVLAGVVSLEEGDQVASFEYAPEFIPLRREIAPIKMPLGAGVHRFPEAPRETLRGLPGLLADAIPDDFGQELIRVWLDTQGRYDRELNAVEQLCYVGSRGMGALEFVPASGPEHASQPTTVEEMTELASLVLGDRAALRERLDEENGSAAVQSLLAAGTSAGGRRPKALISWNRETNEVRSGQISDQEPGFEHWLIKFDGVRGRGLDAPDGSGALEFAYSEMAKRAGVEMTACELFEEGGRRHFVTRRFDRDGPMKLHVQSFGALWHLNHHRSGVHSYELALNTVRRLGMGADEVEQLFRRMLFNIVACNEDDHVKNIAFLLDRDSNAWTLAPAFDLTHVRVPEDVFGSGHAMTVNEKTKRFEVTDVLECAESAQLQRRRPREILAEVVDAVRQWPRFAESARVPEEIADAIGKDHLVDW